MGRRVWVRAALGVGLLLVVAVALACGGDDEGAGATGTASGGEAGSGGAGSGGGDGGAALASRSVVVSDDGGLEALVPEGVSGVTAIRSGDGWTLGPAGMAFEEPVVLRFEWPIGGAGLPVAVLVSDDGTRELPAQVALRRGERMAFTVAVTHFSELVVEEAVGATGVSEGALALAGEGEMARNLARLLESDADLSDEEIEVALALLQNPPSSEPYLPSLELRFLARERDDADGGDSLDPSELDAYAFDRSGRGAFTTVGGGSSSGGGSGDGGGSASGGPTTPLPATAGDFGEGVVDISPHVTVMRTPDGNAWIRFNIPAEADPEAALEAAGSVMLAAIVDGPGTVIESVSRVGADEAGPQVIVRSRSDLSELDREVLPLDRGDVSAGYIDTLLPLDASAAALTVVVNGTAYPAAGMSIQAWVRDAANENLWQGGALVDVAALAALGE